MYATRSAKRTVTTRRSRTGAALATTGAGTGARAGAAPNAPPQVAQNRAPGGGTVPQDGQAGGATAVPHALQNLAPGTGGAAQLEHPTRASSQAAVAAAKGHLRHVDDEPPSGQGQP